MTIDHRGNDPHLSYFKWLEADIENLSRWIEFSKANERTYSIELARLLMTASAEADILAKDLSAKLDAAAGAESINAYQAVLCSHLPPLPDARVAMPSYGMEFSPWSNWKTASNPPDWWTANNKVKHHRAQSFEHANLANVLNAVAGLLVLLVLHQKSQGFTHISWPRLFQPLSFVSPDGGSLRLMLSDDCKVTW